jgi:hypothetical protein
MHQPKITVESDEDRLKNENKIDSLKIVAIGIALVSLIVAGYAAWLGVDQAISS